MRCPSCLSASVFYDDIRGEFVCTRCGLVIYDRVLEAGPQYFTRQIEGTSHIDSSSGEDFTFHDFGLGTTFGLSFEASPALRARLRRLKVVHERSRVSGWTERSLRDGFMEIDRLCEDLGVSKGVKAEACYIYRRAKAKNLLTGRQCWMIGAAAIYLALRGRGIARTEREMVETIVGRYGGDVGKIRKNFRNVTKIISDALKIGTKRISVQDYIAKFSSELGLSPKALEAVTSIYGEIPKNELQGKSPVVVSAALIYLGLRRVGEKKVLREIARATGASLSRLSTVVARFKRLCEGE
ncbi:MAG: transcription initiation factor IIB family protein [Candidatus Hadarchaeales archaeon]